MSDTPSETKAVGQVEACVVSVEYSGHDAEARMDSWWATLEEAEVRAAELNLANIEFGDEQHFAIQFIDTPLVLL